MTQLTATFEAGVAAANMQTSDTGSADAWDVVQRSGASTIVYDGTHPAKGNLGAKLNNGAGSACWLEWGAKLIAGGAPTETYGRVYFYLPSIPTSSMTLIQVLGPAAAVSWNAQIQASTGTVTVFYNTGSNASALTALSATTLYRLEYHAIHSATVGQVELKLFSGDSTSTLQTFSSTANKNTLASANQIRHGQISAGTSGMDIWLDEIVAGAATWPGPATVSASTTNIALADSGQAFLKMKGLL